MSLSTLKIKIPITRTVNGKKKEINYEDLFDLLQKKYNPLKLTGMTCYEYYETTSGKTNKDNLFKPYFDVEIFLNKDDYEKLESSGIPIQTYVHDLKDKLIEILSNLFNVNEDVIAVSTDCRRIFKKKDKYYKISYHLIISNKKVYIPDLHQYIKENLHIFEEEDIPRDAIDLSVYKGNIKKFRIPYTKKIASDKHSLLKPLNFTDKENYHKHLITITEGCEEIKLKIDNVEIERKNEKIRELNNEMTNYYENIKDNINATLNKFKKIGSKKEDKGCICFDIDGFYCGNTHEHNHNYLIHNKSIHTISIKCHSDRCKNFEKVIYKPKTPTEDFAIKFFQAIPIPENSLDNYLSVRDYFEKFFLLIRDSNTYMRIQKKYNNRHKFFEKHYGVIKLEGYSDLTYKCIKEGGKGEIIYKNFLERYKKDIHKNSYLNLTFNPYSPLDKHPPKDNYFNLFPGFNYIDVIDLITQDNISPDKYDDLDFLIDHIKTFICGGIHSKNEKDEDMVEKLFVYLMSFVANIIQNPQIVPHIILILYSKKHGTGKSGFTKFISSILGHDLSFFGTFEQITEKHTTAHVGKLLNVIEEVDNMTTRKYNNKIKDFSQREKAVYNEKGKTIITVDTYVRYFMTTNDNNGVYFNDEDRRYVVYDFTKVEEKYMNRCKALKELGIDGYIAKYEKIINDPEIIYLFGKLLEGYDIPFKSLSQWTKQRPLTKSYYLMKKKDPIEQFFADFGKLESVEVDHLDEEDYYQDENDPDSVIMTGHRLFHNSYKVYHNDNIGSRNYGKTTFYNLLRTDHNDYVKEIKIKNKKHFKISLRELWDKYFPEEEFTNHHFKN